jgi:hypothetical protein
MSWVSTFLIDCMARRDRFLRSTHVVTVMPRFCGCGPPSALISDCNVMNACDSRHGRKSAMDFRVASNCGLRVKCLRQLVNSSCGSHGCGGSRPARPDVSQVVSRTELMSVAHHLCPDGPDAEPHAQAA